ncbi:uncharacterized protein LOC123318875 [Coccinella septempunctata]|uniref:uncharacterized protein LOC123318875 n=1 Tax=Coccinella septempunctata TaxID=41139 RepID=UPI001D0983FB|nr:uncharacterized protein LOC123318875 [Coccinella septempunctata]
MPACKLDSMPRKWPSNESIHAGSTSSSTSGIDSPWSLQSLSPGSTSPDNTLRKRRILRTSSVGSVIQEPFVITTECRVSRSQSPVLQGQQVEEPPSALAELIGWYPLFLFRLVRTLLLVCMPKTWTQLLLAVPKLYINFWIWVLKQTALFPITVIKMMLNFIWVDSAERNRKKRTVLISGGSTIQALHLARNFYCAGARVVVCEVEGQFALARFSTAVSRFYTVPKPTSDQQQNYVRALCEIVDKEQAMYYIPVSASTSAYYDAVAKPHLELLGCSCFCPGIKEVWALDDTLEVMKRCQKYDIPTPVYHSITSKEDVYRLYDTGAVRNGNFVMSTAGPIGLRERCKMVLPPSRNDLKLNFDISEQRPWVAVQDVKGDHFLTCTTVKQSQVVANVTCRLDRSNNGLVPTENQQINQWLSHFFSKLHLLRPITGHISFRFAVNKENGVLVPLSSRVGVSLPYICYTSIHPRLVWKTCKHFSRQNSGVLVNENGKVYISEHKQPAVENVTRLIGTVLDKREVLFLMWDPLPYCAYYHMQIPFKNVLSFIQKKQDSFPRPLTNPVR